MYNMKLASEWAWLTTGGQRKLDGLFKSNPAVVRIMKHVLMFEMHVMLGSEENVGRCCLETAFAHVQLFFLNQKKSYCTCKLIFPPSKSIPTSKHSEKFGHLRQVTIWADAAPRKVEAKIYIPVWGLHGSLGESGPFRCLHPLRGCFEKAVLASGCLFPASCYWVLQLNKSGERVQMSGIRRWRKVYLLWNS